MNIESSERAIVMTRVFDAPRERVFDAFTDPEMVKRWLIAPEGWSLAECAIDLRVGGTFRYVWRNGADGQEFVVSGVYTEIARPARVVHTERFEDPAWPGESVETWTFEERDGATSFTMTLSYASVEACTSAREFGLEDGNAACYDRLAAMLA
jgi:uncharacterized protein YndB with AHSA1/START domain